MLVLALDGVLQFHEFLAELFELGVDRGFCVGTDDVPVLPPLPHQRDKRGHAAEVGHLEEGDGGLKVFGDTLKPGLVDWRGFGFGGGLKGQDAGGELVDGVLEWHGGL